MTSTYLDAASACPLHPVAHQALQAAAADGWHDPGRLYAGARRARQLLDAARESVAESVGAAPGEVSFTTSGTAAVHAGVLGTLLGRARAGNVLVHSAVEHSAVLAAAGHHERGGGRAVAVGVSRTARVDPEEVARTVARGGAALVAVQSANHEVGTTQPIGRIAEAVGDVPLFVDAAQSLGRAPIEEGWTLLAASARKWGGPAGVGVLVARPGARWRSPWPPDSHDPDSPGAANVPTIVAAAASLRAVLAERDTEDARLRALTRRVRRAIPRLVPYAEVVGEDEDRLPHIVAMSYPLESGEPIMMELDRRGFAVSAGSACTASSLRPSHVLEAMGILSTGNVRISLHRETTEDDVERFLRELPSAVAKLREDAGVRDV